VPLQTQCWLEFRELVPLQNASLNIRQRACGEGYKGLMRIMIMVMTVRLALGKRQQLLTCAKKVCPAEMDTPCGDNRAAVAYTQPPRVGVGCICKGGPVVTRGCVHFGWTIFGGTLLWMLMFRHFPGRKVGDYAVTAKCSPEGVCISAGRNFWAQVHRC